LQRWRAGSRFLPLGKPAPSPAPSSARAFSAPGRRGARGCEVCWGSVSEGWSAGSRPFLQSPNIGSIVAVAAVVRSSATILWPASVLTVTKRFSMPRRNAIRAHRQRRYDYARVFLSRPTHVSRRRRNRRSAAFVSPPARTAKQMPILTVSQERLFAMWLGRLHLTSGVLRTARGSL